MQQACSILSAQVLCVLVQEASPVHGMNLWPVQRPAFEASLRQYVESCLGVGQAIMRGACCHISITSPSYI